MRHKQTHGWNRLDSFRIHQGNMKSVLGEESVCFKLLLYAETIQLSALEPHALL
jgi:hypothetical protein